MPPGDTAKPHLDADEIAAFAENALPERLRQPYMAHFAECEGCRKTLSSVILLNSEAGTDAASAVAAPVVTAGAIPWYRKLFLFPNLAYVLGGLVVVFSGFLAVSVLRNAGALVPPAAPGSWAGCRTRCSGHDRDESVQFHPQPVGERLGVGA